MIRKIVVCAFVLALRSSPAEAQYIGIFMDPSAPSCAVQVGPTPWVDLHVVAVLEGDRTEWGAAQFKITGAPTGWTTQNALWVPNEEVLSLGNPLFPTSIQQGQVAATLATLCQNGDGDMFPLGRVVLLGAPTPGDIHLQVEGAVVSPQDPDCPHAVECVGFTKICVGGRGIVLNGKAPPECAVAVQERTWASVKSLYD